MEKLVQCPRCKSERIEKEITTDYPPIKMAPAYRQCKWCGKRFIVDEKGNVIDE